MIFILVVLKITRMANVAITENCRKRLAYVKKPDEYLRDTISRLVDEELGRSNIEIPDAIKS